MAWYADRLLEKSVELKPMVLFSNQFHPQLIKRYMKSLHGVTANLSTMQSFKSYLTILTLSSSWLGVAQVGLLRCRQRDGVQGIKVPYHCEKFSKICLKYFYLTRESELLLTCSL